MLYYTGIGSRETPLDILHTMTQLAMFLGQQDMMLRSGGAPGADTAFEHGCNAVTGPKQIYVPWNGFNNRRDSEPGVYTGASDEALALAEKHHPAWDRCTRAMRLLHARNGYQVLGRSLDEPSEFVLCWTPGGTGKGGTGQAIRVARAYNVPVFDLGSPNVIQELEAHMAKYQG